MPDYVLLLDKDGGLVRVAADEVSVANGSVLANNVMAQRAKFVVGADGVLFDVSRAYPMPTQPAEVSAGQGYIDLTTGGHHEMDEVQKRGGGTGIPAGAQWCAFRADVDVCFADDGSNATATCYDLGAGMEWVYADVGKMAQLSFFSSDAGRIKFWFYS